MWSSLPVSGSLLSPQHPWIYYTKLVKKLQKLTPRQAAFGKNFVVSVADSALQRRPRGGFCHTTSSPRRILPQSYENSCGCSPLTCKENHGKTQIFKIYEGKQIYKKKKNMLHVK
jgi:hypothetical protein